MRDQIPTVRALAEINPDGFLTANGRKTVFPGIGPDTLVKFHERARLVKSLNSRPYLRQPVWGWKNAHRSPVGSSPCTGLGRAPDQEPLPKLFHIRLR